MKKNKNFYTVSKDYYAILGVSSRASIDEIKRAFEEKTYVDPEILEHYNNAKKTLHQQEQLLNKEKDDNAKKEMLHAIEESRQFISQIEEEDLKKDPEVIEAFTVLTNYRKEYDKAREKYLKKENKRADEKVRKHARKIYVLRKKLNKAEQKATRKGVKTTEDLDARLGVDSTASTQDIFVANKEALSVVGVDIEKVSEAYKVLSDKDKNKLYHTVVGYKKQYDTYKSSSEDAKLVKRIEEGYKPHFFSKEARIVLSAASVTVLAAAIIAGALGIAKLFGKNDKNSLKNQQTIESSIGSNESENVITIEPTIPTYDYTINSVSTINNEYLGEEHSINANTISQGASSLLSGTSSLLDNSGTITSSTGSSTNSNESENVNNLHTTTPSTGSNTDSNGSENIDNLDTTTPSVNDDVVTRKAEQLLTSLNNAHMVNVETGLPYEVDELKNMIRYMNGLYVPEDEQDIYYMYTSYINLCLSVWNTEINLLQVNYAGGEISFKSAIEEAAKNPIYINFVEAVNLNDSYGIEYAKWLQDHYYTMLYTTDPELYNKYYNEVWQSFAEITKGNGTTFTLDGITYTVTEEGLLQKGNTGVASLIMLWLFNLQQPNIKAPVQEKFYVNQQFISALEGDQNNYATTDEMIFFINPNCDISMGIDNASQPDDGQTWSDRVQSNMKGTAYEQLASRGNSFSNTR